MIFRERNDLKINKQATASGFPLVRSMIVQFDANALTMEAT